MLTSERNWIIKKRNAAVKQYGNIAVIHARKGAFQIRQAAIKAVKNGDFSSVVSLMTKSALPLVTEMMNVSFLQGFVNSKRQVLQHRPLSLAFETTIDTLKRNVDFDIFKVTSINKQIAKDVIDKAAQHVNDKLKSTVLDLVKSRVPTREAIVAISDAMDDLGMSPEKDFLLETIYRSASTTAYSAGQWSSYQDPDIKEILWGFQYSAVGDDRTRENHLAADGVTLPANHDFWETMWPPNGYNCRCVVVPLFEEEDIVEPPDGAYPDEGFGFNPGIEIADEALEFAFDPDQPRDESGKWTAGGGGDGKIPATFQDRVKYFSKKFPSFSPSNIKKMAATNDRTTPKGVLHVPKKLTMAEVAKVQSEFPGVKVKALNALNYMKANPPGAGKPTREALVAKLAKTNPAVYAKLQALNEIPSTKSSLPKGVTAVYKFEQSDHGANIEGGHAARKQWEQSLGKHEKEAIASWGNGQYQGIRNAEKGILEDTNIPGKPLTDSVKAYNDKHNAGLAAKAKAFNDALDRAPKFTGDLYRGMHIDENNKYYAGLTAVGSTYTLHGSQSATRSADKAASSFGGTQMMLKITGVKNAVNIETLTGHTGEKECILRKESSYKILKVEKNVSVNGKTVKTLIHMEQV